jgi:hypothetical protein
MDIITRGTPPPASAYMITCHQCGSVLRVNRREMTVNPHRVCPMRDWLSVVCPVCYGTIAV